MKGQVQKFETLSDGSIKLSVYCLREQKREAIELSDEEVNITKFSADTVTISKAEYDALVGGKDYLVPQRFIDFVRIIRDTADDALGEIGKEGVQDNG